MIRAENLLTRAVALEHYELGYQHGRAGLKEPDPIGCLFTAYRDGWVQGRRERHWKAGGR